MSQIIQRLLRGRQNTSKNISLHQKSCFVWKLYILLIPHVIKSRIYVAGIMWAFALLTHLPSYWGFWNCTESNITPCNVRAYSLSGFMDYFLPSVGIHISLTLQGLLQVHLLWQTQKYSKCLLNSQDQKLNIHTNDSYCPCLFALSPLLQI